MLRIIANLLRNRRHRKELERLRFVLGAFTDLTAAHDVELMIRIGTRIRRILERRFGPGSETFVHSEEDLMNQQRFVESMPLDRLEKLAHDLSVSADAAGAEEDVAPVASLRLVSGWLKAKAVARASSDERIIAQAREQEALCFREISDLLAVLRDESHLADQHRP